MVPFRHAGLVSSQYRHHASFKVVGAVVGVLIDVGSVFALEGMALLVQRAFTAYPQTVVGGTYPSDSGIEDARLSLGVHLRFIVDGFYGIEDIADRYLGIEGGLGGA